MDFTIVTPSFNQAPYLATTIESVLSQAGEFTLDYIVMDGGSRDESVEVIRKFDHEIATGQYPIRCKRVRMRWFSESDRGQSHAVNKGFALAGGDVLGWLNSDDTYADDHVLAKVFGFFNERPDASFVYGKGYRIDDKGRRTGQEEYITAFGIDDLLEVDYILQPAAFWRRNLHERIGPLDESMHYAFDWDYWIRCSRVAKLDFLDAFLACNRVYGATKTSCGGIPRKAEIVKLLLTYGGFTQRSINAYLIDRHVRTVTREERQASGSAIQTSRISRLVSSFFEQFRPAVRSVLTPTRYIERAIRRRLRGRPEPVAPATLAGPHFHGASQRDRAAA